MLRFLLFLSLSSSVLQAGVRPYVEEEGERLTVISVLENGSAVVEGGRTVKMSRGKMPLRLEEDESIEGSGVTMTISSGPELVIVNDVSWSAMYRFEGNLSEAVALFGVLIRTEENGKQVTIPVSLNLGEDGDPTAFVVSVDPFPSWSDVLKTEPGNFFYEFRLFTEGREILVGESNENPLLVDWGRLEAGEDSKPEVILPVSESFLHYRKKDAEALVEFVIDERGKTQRVSVVRKTAGWFAEPAKRMAEMTRFYPVIKDGKPTAAVVRVPIRFTSQK